MDLTRADVALDTSPAIPRAYQFVSLEQVDSVLQEAGRRADDGADEGVLLLAHRQTAATGRLGQTWVSAAGGLYAALILRPEAPLTQAAQLSLVAMQALVSGAAEHVTPLTELHVRWPNDLLLRQGKVGTVQMRWRLGAGARLDWLALGLYVNVRNAPEAFGFDASSMHVDGEAIVTAEALLGSFARQFLVWVDRWANDGFAPIRKAWLQRAVGLDDENEIRTNAGCFAGRARTLADDGGLLMDTDGRTASVGLDTAFA